MRALRGALLDLDADGRARRLHGRLALTLPHNALGDRGTSRLATLLIKLFARESSTTASPPTAATSLARRASPELRALDVRGNHIGDAGATAFARGCVVNCFQSGNVPFRYFVFFQRWFI